MPRRLQLTKKPKAILFDWDNTLADTWPIIHKSLNQCFVDMGHEPWTIAETQKEVHRSMREYFPELFKDRWEEAGRIYRAHYQQNRKAEPVAMPFAEELLKHLQLSPKIYIAIVSNKPGKYLREDVTRIGWDKYFSKIIGAEDASEDKPSLMPVHLALEGSQVLLTDNIWFVGDSITDMHCAHVMKAKAILYGEPAIHEDIFTNYPPDVHVKCLKELIKILNDCT